MSGLDKLAAAAKKKRKAEMIAMREDQIARMTAIASDKSQPVYVISEAQTSLRFLQSELIRLKRKG